jgi:rhodanese-related sulfurtransferase
MNSKYRFLIVLLALAAMFVTGCSEDSTAPEEDGSASKTLRDYLVDNDMDLPDLLTSWTILASDLHGNEANYHIMDIRSSSAFNTGHVPTSVLSTLSTIVTDAAAATQPIVVVCSSGQTAGHAVMALRLSGYSDAKVLKWGISAWHSDFDAWTANLDDTGPASGNWDAAPGNIVPSTEYDYPSIPGSGDGATILADRVAAMLSGGFKVITPATLLPNPAPYYISNYWAATDVTTYGNITGARRNHPLSIENGTIKNYDPNATVVTYCWSGQTSSMITAYLTVLGYDALSLKFGSNNMIHSSLTGHKFPGSEDYDYDSNPPIN